MITIVYFLNKKNPNEIHQLNDILVVLKHEFYHQ